MLPVLKKPFETSAIQKIVARAEARLSRSRRGARRPCRSAQNNWVEFWYQPKIDMRSKQLAGAEVFARVRHPQHGIMSPGSFMPGADEAEPAGAGRAWRWWMRSRPGSILPSSASICGSRSTFRSPRWSSCRSPTSCARIARRLDNWPGLIIDLTEEQIVKICARQRDDREARRSTTSGSRSTTSAAPTPR